MDKTNKTVRTLMFFLAGFPVIILSSGFLLRNITNSDPIFFAIIICYIAAAIICAVLTSIRYHRQQKIIPREDAENPPEASESQPDSTPAEPRKTAENTPSAALIQLEALQKEYTQLHDTDPQNPRIRDLKQKIAREILLLDKVYIAYDPCMNHRFPYVELSGKIELFSTKSNAEQAKETYSKNHSGTFTPMEISGDKLPDLLKKLCYQGFYALRLDSTGLSVEMDLSLLCRSLPDNVVDRSNAPLRYLFIRELEYAYRLRMLDGAARGTDQERTLREMWLTMGANAYQMFGKSLVYVFTSGPFTPGVTLYTEKAMTEARKLLTRHKLPESALIAPGDNSFDTYHGKLQLRVASRTGTQEVSQSHCCGFTGREEAEEVRRLFAGSGCDDQVVVVTFDEFYAQSLECAGILLDMPTYAREIHKGEFNRILECRSITGGIVVSLNKINPT